MALAPEAAAPALMGRLPPDGFSPKGQDWSFPPPNSEHHRETGYRLFAESIRANGFYGNVVAASDLTILTGHGTRHLWQAVQWSEISFSLRKCLKERISIVCA